MDFEQDLKSEDKEIFDAIERELHLRMAGVCSRNGCGME